MNLDDLDHLDDRELLCVVVGELRALRRLIGTLALLVLVVPVVFLAAALLGR
jgi:hypothetical protein